MIAKKYVEDDLLRLNELYASGITGPDATVPVYYSKLAVLELAGWIEESLDLIAKRAMKGRLHTASFIDRMDLTISGTYGLHLKKNFIPMMVKLVGLQECEELCQYLDSDGSLAILSSDFGAITTQRNNAAHVNISRTTIAFDSPSVTLSRLHRVYPILKEIYSWYCQ